MRPRDILLGPNAFIGQPAESDTILEEVNPELECIVHPDGLREYRLNGALHREDGPAKEDLGGNKKYYIEGKLHRTDGPAFQRIDGYEEWRLDGEKHRADGPAVIFPDGRKEWWSHGKILRTEYSTS